jgi:hypothetical protein
MQPVFEGN